MRRRHDGSGRLRRWRWGGVDNGNNQAGGAENPAPAPAPAPVPDPIPAPAPAPDPVPGKETGTEGSTTAVASPFLGAWKYAPDHYCTDNWPVVPASLQSKRGVMPVEYAFSEGVMTQTYQIFSDLRCTELEGTVTVSATATREAITIAGWPGSVRLNVAYLGYSVTGNIVVDENEAKAEFSAPSDKTIAAVKGKELYFGDRKTKGADGYPTAFNVRPSGYR